ncbi:uncharacterized protein UV8b_05969 [Ustilaginoidea virens]|uniref:Nitroreductase domain-containing protein n=1 Tax=Ustilaginoidea virens TaxID=1159556 RepID=A0A063BLA4_USTVR|nr:uncharacterized protein UV8b_05969 [Ustilaginoidea virens]QUC21726.1 hypothetical protein UV8b_05969 [Ustilaginoidea virens]GAO19959.1 hypothetical protein UVI_02051850 [Ustilaginoidea virens]
MASAPLTADQFLAAASHRRSVYGLKGTSKLSDAQVQRIIEQVLSFAPSSYNTQPVRITLITADKHKQFWDVISAAAEPVLKAAGDHVWNHMSGLFAAFRAAYGSIVFWESGSSVREAAEKHKSAAHMFAEFSDHANGMNQIMVWTALELEGLGANLQHLNAIPAVEAAIKEFCGVPDDYKLKAHMNYGDEAQPHPEKPSKLPFSETLKVL